MCMVKMRMDDEKEKEDGSFNLPVKPLVIAWSCYIIAESCFLLVIFLHSLVMFLDSFLMILPLWRITQEITRHYAFDHQESQGLRSAIST